METVSADIQVTGFCIIFSVYCLVSDKAFACAEVLHVTDQTLDLNLAAVFY